MQFTTVYGCMIENGWELPAEPMLTLVLVVVTMLSPFSVVSIEAAFMLTFGAVAEYAEFNPLALASELPLAFFWSASLFTAFNADVAVAPGATAEVEADVAVAG